MMPECNRITSKIILENDDGECEGSDADFE